MLPEAQDADFHMKTLNRILFALVSAAAVFAVVAFVARPEADASPEVPSNNRVKPAKPEKIAHGERVELRDYLVPGKITVFDFTSEYCPPCRAISPKLDELHARRADIVVVKVDINRPDTKGIDWVSPVALQYNLQGIPHFKVYNPKGELVAEGEKATEMVFEWLNPS